jgi:hypothetical protein
VSNNWVDEAGDGHWAEQSEVFESDQSLSQKVYPSTVVKSAVCPISHFWRRALLTQKSISFCVVIPQTSTL